MQSRRLSAEISLNDCAYRYSFNGKEADNEIATGELDFGARIYDARIGRWLKGEPHFKKYPELSSYCYVANMPIRAIDPDGNDIIVLLDPNCLGWSGHMAMLVGDDKNGWRYISDGGRDDTQPGNGVAGGPALPPGMATFKTLDEFFQQQQSDPTYGRYTDYARFRTTTAQDTLAYNATFAKASSFFQTTDANCADAVSAGMMAAGLDPGYTHCNFDYARGWLYGNPGLAVRPVDRFDDMVANNPGKVVEKRTTETDWTGTDHISITVRAVSRNPSGVTLHQSINMGATAAGCVQSVTFSSGRKICCVNCMSTKVKLRW